ncbi:MAG: carbamoyltransferase, partial [Candidatus Omnitrophica bacterium]|nr:carbamoyltransferase [Candidatus Omnitrophota bacterium]
MIILGINAYHGDSSAAIVVDGKLIAAIEEERIRRIKHWAGLPTKSIEWCLSFAGINLGDVDNIAIARNPLNRLHKKLLRILFKRQSTSFLKARINNYFLNADIKKYLSAEFGINEKKLRAKLFKIGHHRAHISSAFFVSPFKEAAAVSIDGFGDFLSTATAIGKDKKIHCMDYVDFPHSLGIFYTAMTQFLGFLNYGDEYKVMGLSAYGSPVYADKLRNVVKIKNNGFFELDTSYFLHDRGGVEMTWFNEKPEIKRLFSEKLTGLLGASRAKGEDLDRRFRDIAASTQAVYEEVFFHILNSLYTKTKMDRLVLAGGCIQNGLANGKIYGKTPFREIYIPPAAYDAGGAIGAAFYLWHHVLGRPRDFVMDSPFWGPKFEMKDIKAELEKRNLKYEELKEEELCEKTASEIANGKVVGWFQGRSEWGPRALGNRSILADPRRKDMKDILNLRIKKREDFRPFAPSILEEKAAEWFEESR